LFFVERNKKYTFASNYPKGVPKITGWDYTLGTWFG